MKITSIRGICDTYQSLRVQNDNPKGLRTTRVKMEELGANKTAKQKIRTQLSSNFHL